MKQTILVLTTMALFAACGGGADTSALGKKRAERDSLKTVYAELGVKIKDMETWLAENDSTLRRNLSTVTSTPVVAGTFAHYVDVHGMVKADKSAALFAQGGRVRNILVKPGDQVRAGQLLISIDNDLVEKQIAQASTAAELARTTFEKQDALWKQKIGSEMQFLQAKDTEGASTRLVSAALHEQQRLTNITSPFEGMVDDIMVRVGDMASPMQPAARVVNLSAVQLEADVPESYLRSVKERCSGEGHASPASNETFDGSLDHVGQFIDPANRTFKVTRARTEGRGLHAPQPAQRHQHPGHAQLTARWWCRAAPCSRM
jgi:membrane fusion protein (multidrug efflux system)